MWFSGGMPEADEQLRGFALRRVAVLFGDRPFELAEADADLVGHLAGEEALFLLHRVPQGLVAHEHGVEDPLLVVREVVLLEDAEAQVPGMSIDPVSESSSPESILSSVDLPAPFAPVRP